MKAEEAKDNVIKRLIDGVKVVQQKKNGNVYFTCEVLLADWHELNDIAERLDPHKP